MQDSGRIVADTKIDLVLNPAGLLSRGLSLWEPLGFGGQVQNQGYGYLFPMGPFFLVGDLIGVPAWVWQRLWWAVLLFGAYLGVYLLAKAWGIGTPASRMIGALAYALAPRMLTTLGPISSESLAMAVAPWVLLPLVWAARDGRWARGGLLSGVALLFAGGVNAAATLVLCIPPALYLLTRGAGAARRQLAGWWALGVMLATAWWLGPLLILRRVSPPFLDYIEDASTTTRFASLPQALRGAEHWLAFLADSSGPIWRSGWLVVTVPIVIMYTAVVAALGLAGISLRSMPERTFVRALTLVGLLLVTFGYVGAVDGLAAEWARSLLDGPLVAFRNTHKFDPVLRLAIALGVMHLVARAFYFARGRPGWAVVPFAVSALALLGVVGTAFPAYVGQLAPRGSFTSVPDYWQEAVDFLEEGTSDGGRVLLAPGTPFANYLWGAPRDEPIQALGRVPWMTRDAIPLTPPATIRMLDALQSRWASGRPSPGMADQLAAMGVRFLVIRNDLDTSLAKAPLPTVVHEVLRGTTGLRLVADFGPLVGGQLDDGAVVNRGLSQPYRAIEVYEVEPYEGLVTVSRLDSTPVVAGGPENVVDLRDAGIVDASPTILDGDATPNATGPLIQTDGIARREATPGRVDDNVSTRLTPDEVGVLGRRLLDYAAFPDDRGIAAAQWTGDGVITASSAASDINTVGGSRRSAAPFAALDGDLFTSWWSSPNVDGSPWWMVEWRTERLLPALTVAIDQSRPVPRASRVVVTTSSDSQEFVVPDDGILSLPASSTPTKMLRIAAAGGSKTSLAIRDIFGLPPERRTAVVPQPSRPPTVTALASAVDGRPTCVHPSGAVICTDLLARAGEEDGALDRVVWVPAGDPLDIRLQAVPRPGEFLDELIAAADAETGAGMTASASSSLVALPEGAPRAAIDLDLETAWIAGVRDPDPQLALQWGTPRNIGGLQLRQRLGLPASRPLSASIRFPDGEVRAGRFDARGILAFDEPVRASSLVVTFPDVQEVYSVDPSTAGGVILPVGIADLRVIGAVDQQPNPTVSVPIAIACGEGPAITLGDSALSTKGSTTSRDVVQGLPANFEPCGAEAATDSGPLRILATGGDRWSVRNLLLGDPELVDSAPEETVEVVSWGLTDRALRVPPADDWRVLVVRENANSGWSASLDGAELSPARPDGWQQGWLVPPGESGTVELRMGLATVYQGALLGGLVAALVLVAGALRASRHSTRGSPARLYPAEVRARVLWASFGLLLVVAGGLWGAGAFAFAWAWRRWCPVRLSAATPLLVGLLTVLAGAVLALGPWPHSYAGDSWIAGAAVILAVALTVLPEAGNAPHAGRREPQEAGG